MWDWALIILLVAFGVLMVRTIRFILLEKGSPSRTLAWIAFLFLLPVFGLVLYYIFGKDVRRKNVFRRKRKETERIFAAFEKLQSQHNPRFEKGLPPTQKRYRKLIKMVMKNQQTVWTTGNKTKVFHDGRAFFETMFEDLKNAKKRIAIQFYILEQGIVADQLIEILKLKVQEGVEVRIIYDGVGSWNLSDRFVQKLKSFGIELHPFIPLRFFRWPHKINYRNHRKIVVIDGVIGYTGGFNIADKYMLGDPLLGYWRDTHVRIVGPAVLGLWLVFLLDWHFVSGNSVRLDPEMFQDVEKKTGCPIQVIASGPDSNIANIQQVYFSMINLAKRYIYISTPYFIPDESILTALKTAALSEVDVKLMIPYNSDSKMLKWSIRSYLEELLEVGVKVFFYQNGFMHSKVLIADDIVSSIGTANMDERSFSQNFEVNAIIYDKHICKELKSQFLIDLDFCQAVQPEVFRTRSRKEKAMESIARLFSPLI
jgi:cardiolipin synthase